MRIRFAASENALTFSSGSIKMKTRLRILLVGLIAAGAWLVPSGQAAAAEQAAAAPDQKIVGMYIHQHWPYKHPYAARTWTVEDYRGYAEGLKQIGYNTLMIWPILETMPDPLTPSDQANLAKIAQVIDMLHHELHMRAYIVLCPNIMANAEAKNAPFELRHYFFSDVRVNPGDPAAMAKMMAWREKLVRPLANADGFMIIDSDPGGYAGSNNREFADLLVAHRQMFDRLRPGIELNYWVLMGWPSYCRFYSTAELKISTEEEFHEIFTMLKERNPEPWGLAMHASHGEEQLGLAPRVINFRYGGIEGEPSFPMTNFKDAGHDPAYEAGKNGGQRGVMGNSQTHCVQLPNTFAFARGATGKPLTDADYEKFADDLIPGLGRTIVNAWQLVNSTDSAAMNRQADELAGLADARLKPGPLKGLLFNDPRRFVNDLAMMLRFKAAVQEFRVAVDAKQHVLPAFRTMVVTATTWQTQHGYQDAWYDPRMFEALRKLNVPRINEKLDEGFTLKEGATGFDRVRLGLAQIETHTTRLLGAMQQTLIEMERQSSDSKADANK
jgi:hypothetical protein